MIYVRIDLIDWTKYEYNNFKLNGCYNNLWVILTDSSCFRPTAVTLEMTQRDQTSNIWQI